MKKLGVDVAEGGSLERNTGNCRIGNMEVRWQRVC